MSKKNLLFHLPYDVKAKFIARPNRFLTVVQMKNLANGTPFQAHIHDPGRLKELMIKDRELLLRKADNPNRKTKWDVLAARDKQEYVFIHSGYHRVLAENILKKNLISGVENGNLHPEVKVGQSRLDFLVVTPDKRQTYIEVKGCSLINQDRAIFPDAPTQRGTRHVNELIQLHEKGFATKIIVLVFRKDAKVFSPNNITDPAFTQAIRNADRTGVKIHPVKISYNGSDLFFEGEIPVDVNFEEKKER